MVFVVAVRTSHAAATWRAPDSGEASGASSVFYIFDACDPPSAVSAIWIDLIIAFTALDAVQGGYLDSTGVFDLRVRRAAFVDFVWTTQDPIVDVN